MIGIVLAAGNGSRMKASQKNASCKPLIKINDTPLIAFSLENLNKLNIDRVCIVIGKEGNLITQIIGNIYNGLSICYVPQQEPKGLIHALMQAINTLDIDESVLLQLSDEIFLDLKIEEIAHTVLAEKYDFFCGVTLEDDSEKIKHNYAVEIDSHNYLITCTEKPLIITNNIKGTGFCYFSKESIRLLKSEYDENRNQPYDLCDYMNLLLSKNMRGVALHIAEKEININTIKDLQEAQNVMQSNIFPIQ